jgi:hypothetical protein
MLTTDNHIISNKDIPVFPETGIDFATRLVMWVDKYITRDRWSDRDIERTFARRSPIQVIEEGETFYMNPCLDLTLATAGLAQRNGVPHTLVMEEHGPTADYSFNRLHFALELHDTETTWHINYRNGNNVHIGKGNYPGRKDLPQLTFIRKDWYEIDYTIPLHASLGFKTLPQAFKKLFKGYDIAKQLARLKKDNTKRNYEAYQKACSSEFVLHLSK